MNHFSRCVFGALVLYLFAVNPGPAAAQEAPKFSKDGNRLAYLDESDPFYPGLNFPKLTTPQWIGEPGVEAVVILAIDDMRETERYEKFLRPILDRLKQIDGRAPVSIMVNAIAPTNAQLQTWLKEGVSLEVHTLAHPCPCLAKGDFNAAENTYQGCVELMNQIPGNHPVAFRMPCCDSMNSPSPRFYAEIFNRTNGAGQFLAIDSSVMNIPTAKDPSLPRDLVLDLDGGDKFRKYLPVETNATTKVTMKSFTTTIEDYPYPYVIGKLCWEFPAMVPSDWEAFNLHGSTNPVTLADWKSALDITVRKQGVFTFIFHPHGWSSPQQFVEFIDYAVQKHGKKVKFLNFREAEERLDRSVLSGQSLRDATGSRDGVRLLDVDNDGYMDAIIAGRVGSPMTRIWQRDRAVWRETGFPLPLVDPPVSGPHQLASHCFGIIQSNSLPTLLSVSEMGDAHRQTAWNFDGLEWRENGDYSRVGALWATRGDWGIRLRDIDHDGRCELIGGAGQRGAIFAWSDSEKSWKKLSYALPRSTSIVDAKGRDNGLRFVDVNGDGYDDVLFSNEKEFSLHLFVPKANPRLMFEVGWNDEVFAGKRGESELDIPMIVRGGTNRNNGVWFRDGAMWVQNEDTAHLPDKVRRMTFHELLTADQPPPLSPEQALASMRPRPGFKVELVAAEPLVLDPIAFEWGADGRLWVVDMFDYPLGRVESGESKPTRSPHGEEILTPPQGGRYVPGGRIKILEDTDGDGRYDKATVFLDDVNFPTGLLPWRNGVLIAAAPEIFYAEDTNGDGKADKKTVLFTGFVEGNQQHRVNGFDYGLDNWIYGANGESGGSIRVGPDMRRLTNPGGEAVNLRGHDFRFRPDTGGFEAVAGTTQFGRHRDDWGNWFGNNNPVWLWHYHIPEQYLPRNPNLAVKATKHMLADYPNGTRLYPASRTRQRFNDHHQLGHVTSGNSAMPYRDELFGPGFATSVFISDPVHNVVHREVLEPDGVTFTSHRATDETNREFLASTDLWFRPTMLKTGPDGALYIADMYRLVIEHPEWIPKWMQQRLDLRAGSDRGRIYRIYPEGATLRRIPNLDQLDTAGLVAALDSPNGWQRDTAQRLLAQRKDIGSVSSLESLAKNSPNPKVRLQALCTLEGIGPEAVSETAMLAALEDPHAAVREQAVRISESFIRSVPEKRPGRSAVRVGEALVARAADPAVRVRYQAAFTLGDWTDPRAAAALGAIALRDAANADVQTAVMSSAPRHLDGMLDYVFTRTTNVDAAGVIERLVELASAMNHPQAVAHALSLLASQVGSNATGGFAPFAAFLDALSRRRETLEHFTHSAGPETAKAIEQLTPLFASARSVVNDGGASEAQRIAAVRLLGHAPAGSIDAMEMLGRLLRPQESTEVQRAVVSALAQHMDDRAAGLLLSAWKHQSPALRNDVLGALVSRPVSATALLAAVEAGSVPAGQINPAWQQKLLKYSNAAVRERATKMFAGTRTDRQALLMEYAGVGKINGDVEKGRALFRQNCATCHRLRGEGSEVGPDLGSIADKSAQALLVAILDPNQAVEDRYVSYAATTKADREVSGIITSETPNSITLRAPGGKEETLLRGEIRELIGSGLSLMPEGFEKSLKPQDLADLIATLSVK